MKLDQDKETKSDKIQGVRSILKKKKIFRTKIASYTSTCHFLSLKFFFQIYSIQYSDTNCVRYVAIFLLQVEQLLTLYTKKKKVV